MKFATLKSESSRDGELCLVNKTHQLMVRTTYIAPTLQYALDNWDECAPKLNELYLKLNQNQCEGVIPFAPEKLHSPLPRAYQWADGSAYVTHVELVRKARGAELPPNFWTDPLMYQGGSDTFLGPMDPISGLDESFGIDFEGEVAIVTGDVPMGTTAKEAGQYIRLLMLVNDISLRNLTMNELAKGFGFFQSKPSSSFSPLALTPDELSAFWDGERLHRRLFSYLNGKLIGEPDAGQDMTFSFPQLIEHAAKTRKLSAGTIIGSGTVSNTDKSKGSSCLAEKRMLESIHQSGTITTPFMKPGDTIRIEMKDDEDQSIFGAIDQMVTS